MSSEANSTNSGATVKQRPAPGGQAWKKLGITTSDFIQQCFLPSKAGLMGKTEYQMFWLLLQNSPVETTVFMNELLSRLLNADPSAVLAATSVAPSSSSSSASGLSSSAALSGGSSVSSAVSVESLITTVAFVTLMLDFVVVEKQLKNLLDQWRQQTQAGPLPRAYPPIKDVMRWLTLKCEGADIIGPLIIGCSTMHSVSEFHRLSDFVNYPSLDESDLKSGEASFLFLFLRRYLSHSREGSARLSAVLSNTYNKMLTLPQQMKVNPRVAETTFCALLHMLSQFLCMGAHTDTSTVRAIIATLQPFYLWPLPYAAMTRDLMLRLQQELACPGHMLRGKINEEVDTVEVCDPAAVDNSSSSTSAASAQNSQGANTTAESTTGLFYFLDSKCEAAVSCAQIMELRQMKNDYLPARGRRSGGGTSDDNSSSASPPSGLLSSSLQASIVLNMLHNDVGVSESDVALIRALPLDTIQSLYRRCIALTREVAEKPEQARDIRMRTMAAIKASLKEAQSQKLQQDTIKLSESASIAPHTPVLPNASHLMYARPLSYTFPPFDGKTRTLDFPTSSLYPDLLALCDYIVSTYKDNKTGHVPMARIIVAGGDELSHHFLLAYLLLKQKQPILAESVRLRFFLVPFQKNGMAAWLARHDSWYMRHIYSPFRTNNFLVPWIKVDDTTTMEEEKDRQLPPVGSFLRSLVESYGRDSSAHVHNFHVYQCTAYQYADMRDPTCVIPFCQRAEIGSMVVKSVKASSRDAAGGGYGGGGGDANNRAYGANARAPGQDASSRGNDDRDTPPDIEVKYTKMDLSGHVVETVRDDGAPYSSLTVSSVPRRGDGSFPSSPESQWLEMYARLHRTFQKSAVKKNTLVNEPKQHVIELEITCLQQAHQFPILLDGQYFGPFHRVKIGPVMDDKSSSGGRRMKFPVQTFFPIV